MFDPVTQAARSSMLMPLRLPNFCCAMQFMGPLASAPWPALFIPEFVYHVLVR